MQQHYNLSDEVFKELLDKGVTLGDLFMEVPLFTPFGKTKSLADFDAAQVTKVSLMYYVDHKGDFTDGNTDIPKHQEIAKSVFKSLKIEDQMAVLEYISFTIHGE